MKIDSKMTPVSTQALTEQHTAMLARAIMNDKQAAEFEATKECNFAINPPGIGRFRVNAFVQQGRVGLALPSINTTIPRIADLGLPEILKAIVMTTPRRALRVAAPGSGQPTSLSASLF